MTALAGKIAVITGGGRGIGEAVARALAEEGAAVVVSARTVSAIEAVAATLTDEGHRALAVACDVSDPAQVTALREAVEEKLGGAAILVNNAGIATSAPLKRIALEEWNRVMAVNATGTFLCTQAFVPAMLEAGWGRVVNVASVAGKTAMPYIASYAASKHAAIGFTRSIAAELATSGITVNAVCPGYVDTPMTDYSVGRIVEKTGASAEEARAMLEAMSPQKRIFAPEEVAHLVASLCHPRAAGINGQAVVLDGGALMS